MHCTKRLLNRGTHAWLIGNSTAVQTAGAWYCYNISDQTRVHIPLFFFPPDNLCVAQRGHKRQSADDITQ
jgi:hypothetical protein